MAIAASPPVSLSELATEFGGSAPHSMSEYYRGGSYVPDTAGNAGVPTSGTISLSDFYGATALTVLFSGSRDTDTFIGGGDDYRYFKTPAIVDTNGYTWTFRQIAQLGSPNIGKTFVEINANVSESYWTLATWGGDWGTLTQASNETFTAWDGAKTQWLINAKIIPDAHSGQEETLVLYA